MNYRRNGYPDFMVRAMVKAGVTFPSRVIQDAAHPQDESETNLALARHRMLVATTRAESEGARARVRALIMVKGRA